MKYREPQNILVIKCLEEDKINNKLHLLKRARINPMDAALHPPAKCHHSIHRESKTPRGNSSIHSLVCVALLFREREN